MSEVFDPLGNRDPAGPTGRWPRASPPPPGNPAGARLPTALPRLLAGANERSCIDHSPPGEKILAARGQSEVARGLGPVAERLSD